MRLKRLFKSFLYAGKGLLRVFREEQNIRIQLFAGVVVLALSFWLGISLAEFALVMISVTLVLVSELVNSAVERVADILKPRLDSYIKEIKDITAAAVFLSALSSVIVGCLVFIPYLLNL